MAQLQPNLKARAHRSERSKIDKSGWPYLLAALRTLHRRHRRRLALRSLAQSGAPPVKARGLDPLALAKLRHRQAALFVALHELPPRALATPLPTNLLHRLTPVC